MSTTAVGGKPSDVVLGAVATGRDAAVQVAEYGTALAGMAARLAWHGSAPVRAMVPHRNRAAARNIAEAIEAELRSRVVELAQRGEMERRRQHRHASELLDRLVPLIVDAVAVRIDVAAVADRLDLAAITDEILDEIDLPEIIRTSSGSLASNVVVGVRRRGMEVDDVVASVADRLLRRESPMTTRREVGPSLHLSGVPKGARPLQGRPAGFATRAMAGVVDVISVLAFVAVGLLVVNGFVLAVDPVRFEPVLVPFAVTLVGALVISVTYLTIAWASTGRTFGSAVLGVRVVTAGTHARLPLPRALVRAAFATVFPIGLAWVIVSPKRRSLHDRLVGSAVLYQW